MGFEVFLQAFPGTTPSGCSSSEIWKAFTPWVAEECPGVWLIEYDPENTCTAYVGEDQHVTGVMIGRPCYDIRLWNSLFYIMRLGNFLMMWPGMITALVADTCPVGELPPDIIKDFGGLTCVSSGQEVVDQMQANTKRHPAGELERLKKLWHPDES